MPTKRHMAAFNIRQTKNHICFSLVSEPTKLRIPSLDCTMGSDERSEEESPSNEELQPCVT